MITEKKSQITDISTFCYWLHQKGVGIYAIDGRDLMFGHKLHIGTPYRGKRFWTHQIPTSCLPTWFLYTLNIHFVYAHF